MSFSLVSGEWERMKSTLTTTHHSPLTTHHSPLTTHHSPLTTHHSPLTTHRSPLTTHHSSMKTTAAILVETGRPLVIDDIDVPRLAPGQTLVEIGFSGVCHTQLLECRGYRGHDAFLPHCLG